MKLLSSCLLLASVASLAIACSSSAPTDELGTNQSDIRAGSGTCAEAGGTCVGLSPSSCTNGHWADATTASCGTGIGVGCCIVSPPPPPPPPPANTCQQAGGTCVGLSPSSCTNGHWADATTASCGSGLGVGCCIH